jgi:GalNAc-alpha-(1->4)-GalNAc-alpha-(1->3)-diNAcBac-PP-undecaprenol alpha-1,4-N-acetyl-D-galactosaminyltransferase
MRIGLVGSSLLPGGAERVQASLANYWADRHEVFLITIHGTREDFYPLHPAVRRVGLDAARFSSSVGRALVANFRRIAALHRRFVENDIEVVVSFHTRVNVLAILAARLAGVPIIVSERIDRIAYPETLKWRVGQAMTYRFADAVVVQTSRAAEAFRDLAGKISAIPNPIVRPVIDQPVAVAPTPRGYVVAMGRLEFQKGFDLLIEAFGQVVRDHAVDLVIIGEGSGRQSLEQQAQRLGLGERIHFTGVTRQPHALVAAAKMLVAPSRYEGFPNVLLEAMAVGIPVVAADCRSGPSDIIRNGIDGLLVPTEDIGALAEAMRSLLSNEEKRAAMGCAAVSVLERFGVDAIATRWFELISSVVERSRQRSLAA